MATISEAMHAYADAKLAKAAELIDASRRSIPTPPEYLNFDGALRIVEECRSALETAWDLDTLVQHLRTAGANLRQFCGGPAEASVEAAINLIDQAIGGESM
jgi:hypothetical protein